VVLSTDDRDRTWRTAVEVELTRKTEARVGGRARVHVRPYPPPTLAAVA
jgi:hypothetical protein